MINQESLDRIEESQFSSSFGKPLYDSFCFSRIPATISSLFSGKHEEGALPTSCIKEGPYDSVILLFLDAFGWQFFERYSKHPFLQRFIKEGIVSKITTQFPSTTAAHVTSLHTGMQVGETGIYEWFQYEPLLDKMIAPLPFSEAGDSIAGSLLATNVGIDKIFPFTTMYQRLHKSNVESYLFLDAQISQSPYSQALGKGAHSCSYFSLSQGLRSLRELMTTKKENQLYSFLYYAGIDSVGHRKGPDSKSFDAGVFYCLDRLEKEFMKKSSFSGRTALLVTADHGMISVNPRKTIYVNKEIPELASWLDVAAPAGSCRDLFLHVNPQYLSIAIEKLSFLLAGKAEVWKTEDLIKQNLFGAVKQRFLERVGNLVVLPYDGEGVWWSEPGKFQQNFYGSHGGLTRKEMETLFLFLEIDE